MATTYGYDTSTHAMYTASDQTFIYDTAGRSMKTVATAGTDEYTRDITGRAVQHSVTGHPTAKYVYSNDTDSPTAVTDSTGTVAVKLVSLPGGLTVTETGTETNIGVPNLFGSIAVTFKLGTTTIKYDAYDPYGNSVAEAPGTGITLNSPDRYGWHGAQQRLTTNTTGYTPMIDMGARRYNPTTGRFLTPDPIEGGNTNTYNYPNDPINQTDLNGMYSWSTGWFGWGLTAYWSHSQWLSGRSRVLFQGCGQPRWWYQGIVNVEKMLNCDHYRVLIDRPGSLKLGFCVVIFAWVCAHGINSAIAASIGFAITCAISGGVCVLSAPVVAVIAFVASVLATALTRGHISGLNTVAYKVVFGQHSYCAATYIHHGGFSGHWYYYLDGCPGR